MRTTWTFHTAGQLVFGRNAAAKLGEIAGRLGVRRAFIVTDPVLLKAGLVEPVHAPLSEAGVAVEVFSGGEPEPSLRAAATAVAAARDFRPDGVIGLGGGSNMDLAKITAVAADARRPAARLRRRRQDSRPGRCRCCACRPRPAPAPRCPPPASLRTPTIR